MTPADLAAPVDAETRMAIQDFLVAEAEILDDREWEAWLELFTEDIEYTAPVKVHRKSPSPDVVDETRLREWYRPRDLLPGGIETLIGADTTLPETVDRVMTDTGLARLPATDR